MLDRCDYYTIKEAAEMLGLEYTAMRMRLKRGTFPAIVVNGRSVGVLKGEFWHICVQMETNGLIRANGMPQAYKDERQKNIGSVSYDHYVMRGRTAP